MKKLIVLSSLLIAVFFAKTQDVHFAQYTATPLNLNPALTGFMEGNLRVNANYRNQWFKSSSFSTYALSADVNIKRKDMNFNMLGLGLSFYHDIEEKNNYKNTNFNLTAAYNIKLTRYPLQYIGFGISAGIINKQINLMEAVYGNYYETGLNNDPIGLNQFGNLKLDIGFGLSYYVVINEKHAINIGIAVSHINQPNFALYGEDYLFKKYNVYFLSEFELGKTGQFWLKPSFYIAAQGPSIELLPKTKIKIKFLNAVNDVYLEFGGGLRMVGNADRKAISNDFIGEVNFKIDSYSIGFSYEAIFSDLNEITSLNGGPEVSFNMDLDFSKKRKPRYFKILTF